MTTDAFTAEEALHEAWAGSAEQRRAEAEALRMFPDALHLGKFDGLMSDAEIDRRMLIQRQAYELGEKKAWIRAQQEPTDAEVEAATRVIYVRSHHSTGRQAPWERLDLEEQVAWLEDGRAALTAAKEARS